MPIVSIAVEKLRVSPHNVRKSQNKITFEELRASVRAHGLLQPPLVTKADDGFYEVVDGGRRLGVVTALQKEGVYPKGHLVDCNLAGESDIAELSLAANVIREAMHPADEYEAFATLAKEHESAEIAKRFGVTERHVQQRLKLGRVAPEIMKAYREDKLNLETMMAFTLTDDQGVQRKVFKAVKNNPSAFSVRKMLTERKVGSRDKLARFVGIEAYQAAGGKVTGDLFNAEQFLDDPALLQELAANKLKAEEEKLKAEGWSWVVTAMEDEYGFGQKYGRIYSKPVKPPKDVVARHAKLAKECSELETKLQDMSDDDPRYAELDAKSDVMVDELEALETQIHQATYDPEEMKLAGAYVRLDYEGRLKIDRGLVSKKDQKKLAPETGKSAKPEEKGMSQSLRLSLEAFRLQVAEVALASKPELAYDLLVFSAALSLLSDDFGRIDGLDINFHDKTPIMGDVKDTAAANALASLKEKLPLKWLEMEDEGKQFEAFRKLSELQKQFILAHCVALTLEPNLATELDTEGSAYRRTLELTDVNVESYWRPTAENYLSRITRGQLLDIGHEVFSKAWADKWADAKKGEIVKELDRAFTDPKKFGGNKETEEKLRTWLPDGMAFALPEKKSKAKKKAA